jgi:hypothetical protein
MPAVEIIPETRKIALKPSISEINPPSEGPTIPEIENVL